MSIARIHRLLEHTWASLTLADRQALRRQLKALAQRRATLDPATFKARLKTLEERVETALRRRAARLARRPAVTYPEQLPITAQADTIVQAIQAHPVVIVAGDTGSGKSTQLPKMCLAAGRGIDGRIGCTQPRRIAATSIARRVAEEMGEEIGRSVGYKIRFAEQIQSETLIKFMTDGILLAEVQQNALLWEYDTLIIDEAHERSLNIDFLLGVLRTLLPRRPDLKVLITSATLDTEKFSRAFGGAPVIRVEGRLYPVNVVHMPLDPQAEAAGELTYVDQAVRAVEQIRAADRRGDMLVFMPTEHDILEVCGRLESRYLEGTAILPLFARLSEREQQRVFAPTPGQKIVVATNVAETSLTIPGIRYVVDSGLVRMARYLPRTRTTSLPIVPIARSSAEQRKGRCGRVGHGVCIRLYSEDDLLGRPEFTPPEIVRSNLAEVVLRMLDLNLGAVEEFPFIDPPSAKSIQEGFELLQELGAVTRKGRRYHLTSMGRSMARMPVDPRIARMLIAARQEGSLAEVSVIASALSIQDPRERPLDRLAQAEQMHGPFKDPDSDFLTLLRIWRQYHRVWETLNTQNQMRRFCREHFLSFPRMREWRHIHQQILDILRQEGSAAEPEPAADPAPRYAAIHRAILSGFLANIATRRERNFYTAARGREIMLFPGSSLFNKGPQWIVAAEMVKTSRLFARTAAKIDPAWLEAAGGRFCVRTYLDPRWDKTRGQVVADERITLFGLVIVTGRKVPYAPIRPDQAHTIFIQSALVEGRLGPAFAFLKHNQALVNEVAALEDKIRRRDLLVPEDQIAAFYAQRLPGVFDVPTLRRVIREHGGDAFLRMGLSDVLMAPPEAGEVAAYPDEVTLGGHRLGLGYRFAPASPEDGVTLKVPIGLAAGVPAAETDWLVPGLLGDKILALLKGLPKRFRKRLVPLAESAALINAEMPRTAEPLIQALSAFIRRRLGIDIPAAAFSPDELPDHLKMRIAVLDPEGREVRAGREPGILKDDALAEVCRTGAAWQTARREWERSDLKNWDFAQLPEKIVIDPHTVAYPALALENGSVHLKLFSDPEAALESHCRGVEQLLRRPCAKDIKYLTKVVVLPPAAVQGTVDFGGLKAVADAILEAVLRHLLRLDIRTRAEFETRARELAPEILPTGHAYTAVTARVLSAYRDTRLVLQNLAQAHRGQPEQIGFLTALTRELTALLPPDFLKRYDLPRLEHLPRYLKALEIRALRGTNDPAKERLKAAQLEVFAAPLRGLVAELPPDATRARRAALAEATWMLEEYKVSLFAQELKTAFPVSPKRLQAALDEIRRLI